MKKVRLAVCLVSVVALLSACGGGGGGDNRAVPANSVEVRGRISDLANVSIQGARVVAIKADGAVISSAVSDVAGQYVLSVPAVGGISGVPSLTLRVDAQDYQSVPGGVRPSKALDITASGQTGSGVPVIQNASSDISLISLPSGSRGSIAGTVTGDNRDGVLVVGGGSSALSGPDGGFVLFNVTPGSVTVNGYAAGLQFTPATVTVTAGAQATGATLNPSGAATGSLSGSINLINTPVGATTSIVLAVKGTFNDISESGEVPRGLRVQRVSGSFTISGVPQGEYLLLAAGENDGLVRNPDPAIAGTQLVSVTVGTGSVTVPSAIQVIAALNHPTPGQAGPEKITTTPTFTWDDVSGEDYYSVSVFDSFGALVWEKPDVPKITGAGSVSVTYGGSALSPGFYQFRATSWRTVGPTPISRTEEQRGQFYVCGANCP